ncbi:hypothetical protein [Nonomuraea sp. NPDC049758]
MPVLRNLADLREVSWAASLDEPAATAAPALREALSTWFGPS